MRNCANKDNLLNNQRLAWFEKDLPSGGIVIRCGGCYNVMIHWSDQEGQYYECDHCGRELLYPSWCEW